MNRIARALTGLNDRKLLVPFFTGGFPTLRQSMRYVEIAASAGADMIEIGIPFSDPMADGPQIQYSSKVALETGTALAHILGAVASLRKRLDTPLLLMGYYNPVLAFGEERFMRKASGAGVDGLIVPDIPVDEARRFRMHAEAEGLSAVFLVAPTTSDERIKLIDNSSSHFVYAVTVAGVTGARRGFGTDTFDYLSRLKVQLRKPFVAGFGVSSPESARRLVRYANGVVVGSALVHTIRDARTVRASEKAVDAFLRSLRRTL
jgi:tryptophan synthase alpha chain